MAGQIKLHVESLQSASTKLKDQGNSFEDLVNQMQTLVDSLRESWEGEAANAYAEQFTNLKPGLDKTRALINTIAVQIDQTLQAAQDLDSNIASKLK